MSDTMTTEAETAPTEAAPTEAEPVVIPRPDDPFAAQWHDRVIDALADLERMTKAAQASAETGREAAKAIVHVTYTRDLFALNGENDSVARLNTLLADLTTASGTDRTEGDTLAAKVLAMLGSGVDGLSPLLTERAETVVAGWQATAARKGGKGSGGSKSAGTGIRVEMHCGCGWVGRDASGTNSARWGWTGHLVAKHPAFTERPAKGSADHTVLTNVIDPIAKGTETRTEATLSDGTKVYAIIDPS